MYSVTRPDYRLYLVTDREIIGSKSFYASIEQAIDGGVTFLQLREKSISSREFYQLAQSVKKIAVRFNIPLVINDRLDIALAVDADGVHVGQSDLPVEVARQLLGPNKIIGVSASQVDEALAAEQGGADYLGVGAIFPTGTKTDARLVSLTELEKIKQIVNIPVVAIGGINEENAAAVMDTGIDGISVVSAILAKENTKQASAKLLEIIRKTRNEK
ncbi:Thiamine-phosphate synthase [bioreactor metagenome]|uniref:thiamine phosphate synthase n=1 Tax=bioreactor metagenome TaxID=1076179 RepID=A0A644W1N6_9ZZZZ|nr:thiamine phosphate synthase [Negativicutes bacterium]